MPLPVALAMELPAACMLTPDAPDSSVRPSALAPAAEPSMASALSAVTSLAGPIVSDARAFVPPTTSSSRSEPPPGRRTRFFAPSTVPLKVVPLETRVTSPASASAPSTTGPFQVWVPVFVTLARSRIGVPLTVRFGDPNVSAPPDAADDCSMTGGLAESPMTISRAATLVIWAAAEESRRITCPALALRMLRVDFVTNSPFVPVPKV